MVFIEFFSFIINFVFFVLWKQIIKRLIFLVMGNHQIERILNKKSPEYYIFLDLSINIFYKIKKII
jgi:hypothetical protein